VTEDGFRFGTADRRGFLAWLGAASAAVWRPGRRTAGGGAPAIEARPTALFQQPDGRNNLLRVTATGVDAPAARARVFDRRGTLVGTAGLLPAPTGTALVGEVWVPLGAPADFTIELEVAKQRVLRTRVRLVPPRRWTLYWLASNRTDIGSTDLQERCLEIHRENLDFAVARLAAHPAYRWTAECTYQIISYIENRSAAAAEALLQAIRDGKIGFQALFANLLSGLLDHETFARMAWPAGVLARDHGLGFMSAQLTGAPGQPLTFPSVLAASGVRYLATGVDPERAVPLFDAADATGYRFPGEHAAYPQIYWWEGPDGGRVLHWRGHGAGAGARLGFDRGAEVMGRRLSDWLLSDPMLVSPAYPYDIALLYGAGETNAPVDDRLVDTVEEFNRRFAYPAIVPGRAEDFFLELERRHGTRIPVRRGDTGLYREDGAASTAASLAQFRALQLVARAVEILALWDDRTEPHDTAGAARIAARAAERRAAWQDLLLFGEQTWGARDSVSAPGSRQTVAQWQYKQRYLAGAAAALELHLADGLGRLGAATNSGGGRIVFNASTWSRSDIARVPDGAGKRFTVADREVPAVDQPDGSALILVRDVPALGYLRLEEGERAAAPPVDEGASREAAAGGFHVLLDQQTGAIRSLTGADGKERVNPATWSGLNQLVYARGGQASALWTDLAGAGLATPPDLTLAQARLVAARRERLPGIGVRLVAARALDGFPATTSIVTLYDELPWIDVENRLTKTATLEKEALYVAFPFALAKPTVEVEVPLGRMTVERDQQPGSCRDWFCHTHWVWLHTTTDGVLWSGPDTPLFTLNDVFRGAWRRRIEPDGTLFAYAMHNYWPANFAARQDGEFRCRFRLSLLPPGDAAEPVRRGWAAADPLYVGPRFTNAAPGPLIGRDSALTLADRGTLVLGAKRADDGDGAVVKLLDVSGTARSVGVWPAAYAFTQARRTDLVERNREQLPVAGDRHVEVTLAAWGLGAARLSTPAGT
jgi:hypothetical protein